MFGTSVSRTDHFENVPPDTAVGVLQITVYNARGLKGVKIGGGVPDPYVSFDIGSRTGLAKTKTKHSSWVTVEDRKNGRVQLCED